MGIARRDVAGAPGGDSAPLFGRAARRRAARIMRPAAWAWNGLPVTGTNVGAVRSIVTGPTAPLDQLDMHAGTEWGRREYSK